MLDKKLIKEKFTKNISTYSYNAIVQEEIANRLADFCKGKHDNILEIGSYTGLLTKKLIKKVEFKNYTAIDIINSFDYIKNLNRNIKFILGDIEKLELTEKYDLIASSSSLQWCNDFYKVIKKLKNHLNPCGRLIISVFGKKNLYQIKEAFGVSLDYPDIKEIKKILPNAKIFEETKTLQFNTTREVLRHMKNTGVNSFKNTYTYSQIKEKMKILEKEFDNKLTYNPLYIIN